jgi:predicted nucleic acid-binding protein
VVDAFVDTAILVDIMRNHPPVTQWMQVNQTLEAGVIPTVWMELVQGSRDKQAQEQALKLLALFELIHFVQADVTWAMQQLRTYHLSHNIGANDCLIASVAYRLQVPLYTQNLKHFTPILGSLAQKSY